MGQSNDGAAIENGVGCAEPQNLSFGAIGGGTVEAGPRLAQAFIVRIPELACGCVAAEGPGGTGFRPVENAAQIAGETGYRLRGQAAAVGETLTSTDAGPEAAVGETVVRPGAMEMLDEFMLGDVADEGDVSPGSLQRMVAIEGAEMAGIPGGTEQWGKMAALPAESLKYTGKLLGEQEETAVGGRILVAQGVDEAVGGEAGGGYAVIDPRGVDFREETRDLAPT